MTFPLRNSFMTFPLRNIRSMLVSSKHFVFLVVAFF